MMEMKPQRTPPPSPDPPPQALPVKGNAPAWIAVSERDSPALCIEEEETVSGPRSPSPGRCVVLCWPGLVAFPGRSYPLGSSS